MNAKILPLLLALICLFSCEDQEKKLDQLRSQQLHNISEFGALPLHQSFQTACAQLSQSVQTFAQAPNMEQLSLVQKQWQQAGELFKRCELYDIGEVNSQFIHFRLHRWPINEQRLEDTLQMNPAISTDRVANLGSALVGIAALEYLLFEQTPEQTLAQFQKEPKRLQYLQGCAAYLDQKATELQTIWKNYHPTFITALESRISGGQNQITNSLVAYLEETSKLRLGKALGEADGGLVDTSKLEAYRSDASLAFIKSGFAEWKHCYKGEFPNSTDIFGLDDYLVALGNQDLVNRVQTAIEACDAALNELSSLNQDINGQKAKVTAVKTAFSTLAVLLKTEVASFIGVTITVNDSDGD
ncbi:MAG: imelysin family protein [Bacteroidota bacterium]